MGLLEELNKEFVEKKVLRKYVILRIKRFEQHLRETKNITEKTRYEINGRVKELENLKGKSFKNMKSEIKQMQRHFHWKAKAK